MRVLSLIHEENAALGVFADAIDADIEEASYALGRPPSRDPSEYDAVVLLGGEANVDEDGRHAWLPHEKEVVADLVRRGRPLLGVCLGAQLVADAAGAAVGPLDGGPEIGWHEVERLPAAADDPVAAVLPDRFLALQWHGYGFQTVPGATELARGPAGLAAFRLPGRPIWAVQFHAEVTAASLASWMRSHPDVATEAFAAQNEREIGRWNELGRRLCAAFIRAASR
jgi:GMP synthase-like glutamine amidotransferase